MKKIQKFIEELEEIGIDFKTQLSEESYQYYLELKKNKSFNMTENGIKILSYMQNNFDKCNNTFKAKEIGEGLFMSSRSISGSMRKLISDGYVEKTGSDPVIYSITDYGKLKELK